MVTCCSLTTDKKRPVWKVNQSKTSVGPAEITAWKGTFPQSLFL